MWIRLKKPYAVFYPPRLEPAGSVHSVGGPRGVSLVAAGIAEVTAEPPERDDELNFRNNGCIDVAVAHDVVRNRPIATPPLSAQANALVAALSRRVRRKIARKF